MPPPPHAAHQQQPLQAAASWITYHVMHRASLPAPGLGAETVRVLAGAGADVVLCARSLQAGQRVADEITAGLAAAHSARGAGTPAPGRITVAPLDLSDLRSVEACAAHPAVAGLPSITHLVLNAGALPPLLGSRTCKARLAAQHCCGAGQLQAAPVPRPPTHPSALLLRMLMQASWGCRAGR